MSSLKDVAQKAGVSVAAVSSVLGAKSSRIRVGADSRARILCAAQELNYKRHPWAASLRTGKSGTIGLCAQDADALLAHPEGARRFWAICQGAAQKGFGINLVGIGPEQRLDHRLMDGCIVIGFVHPPLHEALTALAGEIPVLTTGPSIPGGIEVRLDMFWVAHRRMAAEYLYDLGHRHIAVAYLKNAGPNADVPRLFRDIAKTRGLDACIDGLGELTLPHRYESLDALWKLDPLPTAVYAIDDPHARALISHLAQRGYRVPQDISVFSGNTHPGESPYVPALTGLDLHYDEVLREIASLFVALIEEGSDAREISPRSPRVELLVRSSCAAQAAPLVRSLAAEGCSMSAK